MSLPTGSVGMGLSAGLRVSFDSTTPRPTLGLSRQCSSALHGMTTTGRGTPTGSIAFGRRQELMGSPRFVCLFMPRHRQRHLARQSRRTPRPDSHGRLAGRQDPETFSAFMVRRTCSGSPVLFLDPEDHTWFPLVTLHLQALSPPTQPDVLLMHLGRRPLALATVDPFFGGASCQVSLARRPRAHVADVRDRALLVDDQERRRPRRSPLGTCPAGRPSTGSSITAGMTDLLFEVIGQRGVGQQHLSFTRSLPAHRLWPVSSGNETGSVATQEIRSCPT